MRIAIAPICIGMYRLMTSKVQSPLD